MCELNFKKKENYEQMLPIWNAEVQSSTSGLLSA